MQKRVIFHNWTSKKIQLKESNHITIHFKIYLTINELFWRGTLINQNKKNKSLSWFAGICKDITESIKEVNLHKKKTPISRGPSWNYINKCLLVSTVLVRPLLHTLLDYFIFFFSVGGEKECYLTVTCASTIFQYICHWKTPNFERMVLN